MAKFLYPENRQFLTKKIDAPVNQEEILENLAKQMREWRSPFGIFYYATLIVMWLAILSGMLVVSSAPLRPPLGVMHICGMVILIPLFLLSLFGLSLQIKAGVKYVFHPRGIQLLMDDALKRRKVVEGKIISIEIGQENIIIFSFISSYRKWEIIESYSFDNLEIDFDIENDRLVVLRHYSTAVLL